MEITELQIQSLQSKDWSDEQREHLEQLGDEAVVSLTEAQPVLDTLLREFRKLAKSNGKIAALAMSNSAKQGSSTLNNDVVAATTSALAIKESLDVIESLLPQFAGLKQQNAELVDSIIALATTEGS